MLIPTRHRQPANQIAGVITTTTKKDTGRGVLLDVDNDGFAEGTDWIGSRDGILVLNRTSSGEPADGQVNRGTDLFNDAGGGRDPAWAVCAL